MFGQLPKLFNRNFAIGYFLPVAAFFAASLVLINGYGLLSAVLDVNDVGQIDILVGSTLIGLISWLGGISLLAMNKGIIRLMEGYGRYNPIRLFDVLERHRYRKIKQEISRLDKEYLAHLSQNEPIPQELRQKRNRLMRIMVERFPDDERWLLPTPFGNIIRAFEVYSRVMYGLDAVPGWNRLLMVIPEENRGLVDDAKAQVDFWVNLWLLSIVALIEYLGFVACTTQVKAYWFPVLAFCAALIGFSRASSSAIEWGSLVKSSFDVFLPELRKKLGFTEPSNEDAEKSQWCEFSQAIIYRLPKRLPTRIEQPPNGDIDQAAAAVEQMSSMDLVKVVMQRIFSGKPR
jgi:hypothetical protein